MSNRVEIEPASMAQVHRTKVGRNVGIADDVLGIARQLKEIDSSLRLEYDPGEDFFIVFQRRILPDGSEQDSLVLTAQTLDGRVLNRVREIASPGYDFIADMDRRDDAAERRRRHEFAESVGPVAERLAHALRKDLGLDSGSQRHRALKDAAKKGRRR